MGGDFIDLTIDTSALDRATDAIDVLPDAIERHLQLAAAQSSDVQEIIAQGVSAALDEFKAAVESKGS